MNDDDKLSGLYQQSRTDEPPMKLDAAVLGHARKAVARKPFRLSRWLAPMAAVATVMLTTSLIIVMKSEHPEVMQGNVVTDKLISPEPMTKEASPATVESGISRDQAAPARSRMAPAGEAAPQPKALQEERLLKAMPAAPAARDAASDMEKEKKAEGVTGAAVGGVSGNTAGKAPAAVMKKQKVLSPEAWLAEILRLREDGRETEVAENMQRFRMQYPDYKIPDDFPIK
ncbi:MAG TPA: hypothetical protein VKA31_03570 [Mariprofundaceae bacterium]|nr:hypothetical protein [Mariprofundaceae bacterium]